MSRSQVVERNSVLISSQKLRLITFSYEKSQNLLCSPFCLFMNREKVLLSSNKYRFHECFFFHRHFNVIDNSWIFSRSSFYPLLSLVHMEKISTSLNASWLRVMQKSQAPLFVCSMANQSFFFICSVVCVYVYICHGNTVALSMNVSVWVCCHITPEFHVYMYLIMSRYFF